jgi:hypothetical protein
MRRWTSSFANSVISCGNAGVKIREISKGQEEKERESKWMAVRAEGVVG